MSGIAYRVDASADLLTWMPLTNFVSTNAVMPFQDSGASNYSQRFYRAAMQ
jgi:hypothetical protein